VLPDDYSMTMTNERFLKSDPNKVKSGCVFSSRDQLVSLSGSSSFRFSDGTFKSRIFTKLYYSWLLLNV
jgi:hypothetical protein